jgi:hypothetical protein
VSFTKKNLATLPPQEAVRYRKRRNVVNIFTTFWIWIIQLILNGISVTFLLYVFGRFKFYQVSAEIDRASQSDQIGRLNTLGIFAKITEMAQKIVLLFSH